MSHDTTDGQVIAGLVADRLECVADRVEADARAARMLLREAEALCAVPREISATFTDFTKDPQVLLARRKAIGDMIERLTATK